MIRRLPIVPTLVVNDSGPQSIPTNRSYTVRRGDTLTAISQRFGVATPTLMALNDIRLRAARYVVMIPAARGINS